MQAMTSLSPVCSQMPSGKYSIFLLHQQILTIDVTLIAFLSFVFLADQ
uniref:Uncharacterized protein n=1 Tax=Arundo donax TaxID=35708 RepID=A0A0A9EXW4_ARUDO